jgi:hypothetical protein
MSVMEMESIDEFLVHAELTNREFESRRGPMAQAGATRGRLASLPVA